MSTMMLTCLTALALGVGGAKNYPRPDLLIEPGEVAKPEIAKKFRILDVRAAKAFTASRIPQASNVNVGDWNKKFTAGPDVMVWQAELGNLGIDADTAVVVYGDDMTNVARAWWILRYWGLKDVRILNGGMGGWLEGKYPVESKGNADAVAKKTPHLTPAEQRLATKDQIKDSLKDKLFQIVDARSAAEHRGDLPGAKRGGAIPGAVNLEWKILVDTNTQRFKSPAELEQIFKKAGIDLAKPCVAHCQSGARSSVMVFAMELMGATDARNYYRSWAEWGNADDTPIVVPKK